MKRLCGFIDWIVNMKLMKSCKQKTGMVKAPRQKVMMISSNFGSMCLIIMMQAQIEQNQQEG